MDIVTAQSARQALDILKLGRDIGNRQVKQIAAYITSTESEVERLNKAVYVPGSWRCAKCNFVLLQSNLNANGTITARDEPGTKCPNDGAPMWRRSWKEYAAEMSEMSERQWEENEILKKRIAELEAMKNPG